MTAVSALAAINAFATSWPEFKVPNLLMQRTDINGKGLTACGVKMSEAIHRVTRGENPDVPVGLLSRFPMLDPVEKVLSDFHLYCAIVLAVVVYVNFFGPKGNDPDPKKAAFHVWFGRIYSWVMAPHYAIVGLILNYFAIFRPQMEDWALGLDLTGWRAQAAYITPFGLNVLVASLMGLLLGKNSLVPLKPWATVLKVISTTSIIFWCTIGVYMQGSQMFGGMGAFGLPVEKVLSGAGKETTENQEWYATVAFLTFQAGFAQCFLDYINYKVLCVVEESGFSVVSWKDMHKWCMLDLAFQTGFILGFFVAFIPYCSFGFPEWTCLPIGVAAIVAMVFIWPVFVHFAWMKAFIKAVLAGTLKEFSKNSHKWDVPYKSNAAAKTK